MKILYITPYAPGHIRVRSFHLASHLALAGHRVTLAYPERRGDYQNRVNELRDQGVAVIVTRTSAWSRGLNSALALLRRRPVQAGYGWSAPLARRLADEVERDPPDVVHVEHLRAMDYGRSLDHGDHRRSWVTVWDSVDCISALLAETRHRSRSKFAVRAGTTTTWWTGDDIASLQGAANLADASAEGDRRDITKTLDDGFVVHGAIGSLRPNAFGLHDMTGNVWEWCRDWFGIYDYPVAPGHGERQVPDKDPRVRARRGGSFASTPSDLRSAARFHNPPNGRISDLGVRPARELELP